jgi:hypothetical protein
VVHGMANAQRTIIASNGTSLLGLDSADQISKTIQRLNLPLTFPQIDYLGAQLVQWLGLNHSP